MVFDDEMATNENKRLMAEAESDRPMTRTLRDKISDRFRSFMVDYEDDCGVPEAEADAILSVIAESVEPLVWHQEDESESLCWTSDAFGLTYEAGVDISGQAYWGFFRSPFSADTLVCGGIEDAKAAAQADLTHRILSALGLSTPEQEKG